MGLNLFGGTNSQQTSKQQQVGVEGGVGVGANSGSGNSSGAGIVDLRGLKISGPKGGKKGGSVSASGGGTPSVSVTSVTTSDSPEAFAAIVQSTQLAFNGENAVTQHALDVVGAAAIGAQSLAAYSVAQSANLQGRLIDQSREATHDALLQSADISEAATSNPDNSVQLNPSGASNPNRVVIYAIVAIGVVLIAVYAKKN